MGRESDSRQRMPTDVPQHCEAINEKKNTKVNQIVEQRGSKAIPHRGVKLRQGRTNGTGKEEKRDLRKK